MSPLRHQLPSSAERGVVAEEVVAAEVVAAEVAEEVAEEVAKLEQNRCHKLKAAKERQEQRWGHLRSVAKTF